MRVFTPFERIACVNRYATGSACVDSWTTRAVRFCFPEDLSGDRGPLALAEEEEGEEVGEGAALGPLEVDVGGAAGGVADVEKEGGEGVGDGGGLQGQDAVTVVEDLAPDRQARLEFRGVQDCDLHEHEVIAGDVVV